MEIIPAIDLRGGKCVRLLRGNYACETVYSEDPIEVAKNWENLGATRIHVVDLDGARTGSPENLDVVKFMASTVSVPIQLGGGMREIKIIEDVMSVGVDRVVLGTAALEKSDFVEDLSSVIGPKSLVVSLDSKDGYVYVRGWTESTKVRIIDLVTRMQGLGVCRFMYTDIDRDGTLTSPNFHVIKDLINRIDSQLIVAGGITSTQHLVELSSIGVEAAVIGRALYTNDIDLKQAIMTIN